MVVVVVASRGVACREELRSVPGPVLTPYMPSSAADDPLGIRLPAPLAGEDRKPLAAPMRSAAGALPPLCVVAVRPWCWRRAHHALPAQPPSRAAAPLCMCMQVPHAACLPLVLQSDAAGVAAPAAACLSSPAPHAEAAPAPEVEATEAAGVEAAHRARRPKVRLAGSMALKLKPLQTCSPPTATGWQGGSSQARWPAAGGCSST